MKTYKDCDRIYLGSSDMASLILRTWAGPTMLHFGGDDSYMAYLIDDDNVTIPDHYKLVLETESWLKVYDDTGMPLEIVADDISVYRAGYFGCIIRVSGETEPIINTY